MVRSLFISTTLVVLTFLLLAQSASAQGILELTLYEGCYFGHTMDTREAYCKIEDGSAIIVNSFHHCRSLCEDAGVYPPDVIQFGCTNERASNYDPNATDDDLSCVYERGCTDPAAINYSPTAGIDDGSCIYPQPFNPRNFAGCTDPSALNYDSLAYSDDGSCQYGSNSSNACSCAPNDFMCLAVCAASS